MKEIVSRRRRVMLALDILLILMEVYALAVSWMESGARLFRYYTQDSNILALLVCILCLVKNLSCMKRGRSMPGWTRHLRYLAASCLMATLLISAFLLTPVEGSGFAAFMLQGKYLFLHTLCPLLMLVQLLLHAGPGLGERHALAALIPTIIYGAISLMMNAAQVYSGPYPFLRIREQEGYVTAVGCIAVLGVNYLAARWIAFFCRRNTR